MDVSDVRRRVREVIDHAKRAVNERRTVVADASRDYEQFLERVATPLFRQIGNVLRTEGHPFTISTPAGSVRLSSDRSAQDYVELTFDASGRQPQVVVHSSHSRGRRVVESEVPLGRGGLVRDLTEEDVLTAVMTALAPIVER
jgi:hypothetical protein